MTDMLEPSLLTAPPVLTVRGCEVMAELYRTLPAAFDGLLQLGCIAVSGGSMTTQTVTQISAAARGKWPVILQMLRIDVPENGRHGPCPKCGGKDRFRLDDLDGRGTWICSQCGNGDGLDLVKLITGYGVRKAAQEVAQVLNVPDVQELPVKPARQKAPKRDMSLTVAALMKESHTGESPYLTGKGFAGYPASLTGSVQHISGKDFPAGSLLLPLTTNAGAVTGAQLIAPTGEKSILPGSTMKGAFVALSPLPSEPPVQVVITEGYATALTVKPAHRRMRSGRHICGQPAQRRTGAAGTLA
ncbi:Uncharacterized protein conserved in bacteria [Serratia liquefaciens]|nr:Uncharacterized protein conserved in bacteria [Serratia liquefaciens]